jgi:hypothetical protein
MSFCSSLSGALALQALDTVLCHGDALLRETQTDFRVPQNITQHAIVPRSGLPVKTMLQQ